MHSTLCRTRKRKEIEEGKKENPSTCTIYTCIRVSLHCVYNVLKTDAENWTISACTNVQRN